jgi:hypothetical protein
MFTKAVSSETKTNLALLGKSNLLKDAYLAGGTAVALQLGHRLSWEEVKRFFEIEVKKLSVKFVMITD